LLTSQHPSHTPPSTLSLHDALPIFARVVAPDLILLRVDERGVGETLACGTGACATVAAAMSEQPMAERVIVRVPGGDLFVRPGPRVFELAGPAEYVFEGSTR